MKVVTIYLILIILYCVYTSAERISETKCREYSRIPTNTTQSHPHLVWIIYLTTSNKWQYYGIVGTLISEKFVLSWAVRNAIVNRTHVYFTHEERYRIVEWLLHPLYRVETFHEIGLLKLEHSLDLDSFHRPACLWTSRYFESTTVELVFCNRAKRADIFESKIFEVVPGPMCNDSLLCMQGINIVFREVPTAGSPLQIKNPNINLPQNHYVYGVFSSFTESEAKQKFRSLRTYKYLNWIESQVWPTAYDISIKRYGERISVTKCREYSRIPTNVSKLQPHLAWFYYLVKGHPGSFLGLGTLISDKFVLTTAVLNVIVNSSQVYFTPNEQYNIAEWHIHPLYDDQTNASHNDIAILKLERAVILDSFHRPACLWTRKYFESTTAELVRWNTTWTDDYDIKQLSVLTGLACTGFDPQHNETIICLKSIAAKDNQYIPTSGSPVQILNPKAGLPDNFYIYGIFSFYYDISPYTKIGTKIYAHLDWIESHVWPTEVSSCGKVDAFFRSPNPSITLPGEFPWHTAIYQFVNLNDRSYKCDGILLNELTILTAADCVPNPFKDGTSGLLLAILGLNNLEVMSPDRQEKLVDRITMKYNDNNVLHENDLALLKLRSAVTFTNFIQPICLTSNDLLFENRDGILPGWGKMNFNMRANRLSKGFVSVQNQTNDGHFYGAYKNVTGACSGGLGGGLVVEVQGRWCLKGIMVRGGSSDELNSCDPLEVLKFTDAVKWYQWIMK